MQGVRVRDTCPHGEPSVQSNAHRSAYWGVAWESERYTDAPSSDGEAWTPQWIQVSQKGKGAFLFLMAPPT